MENLKVFKINDYDWVCAKTAEEALNWYVKETGVDDGLTPKEIEECSLDNTMYTDETGEAKITFKEMITQNANEGMNTPYIICSTEY